MTSFEYDPAKSRGNEERHGISLAWAEGLWDVAHVVVPAKNVAGENRFLILGEVESKVYAAIFTWRGATVRLISCHRADERLSRIYEKAIRTQAEE
jgi:uncharacterized DUF497 family protein